MRRRARPRNAGAMSFDLHGDKSMKTPAPVDCRIGCYISDQPTSHVEVRYAPNGVPYLYVKSAGVIACTKIVVIAEVDNFLKTEATIFLNSADDGSSDDGAADD